MINVNYKQQSVQRDTKKHSCKKRMRCAESLHTANSAERLVNSPLNHNTDQDDEKNRVKEVILSLK